MNIRRVLIDDLDQLVLLFDAYRVWYRKQSDREGALRFLQARVSRDESIIYGAFTPGDEMVGFTQLYPLFSSTRMARIWLLNDLYIMAAYRGLGLSKQLIDRAKELAVETGAQGIALETEVSNEIGNALYPRMDFVLEEGFNHYGFWTNTSSG